MAKIETAGTAFKYYQLHYEKPVHRDTYLPIVSGFLLFLANKVIDGFFIKLAGGDSLGTLGIRGIKNKPKILENGNVRGMAPSWGKTFRLWKNDPVAKANRTVIQCFNEHTNGIRYKAVWLKADARLVGKTMYNFQISDKISSTVHKKIMEGKEYHVKENHQDKRDKYGNNNYQEGYQEGRG